MDSQIPIKDIPREKGFPIAHLFRISALELKPTKSGDKTYLAMTLADSTGEFNFSKKWDCNKDDYDRFKDSKVVFVTGKTDLFNGNLSVICDTIAEPEEGVDTSTLLGKLLPTSLYDVNFLKREVWNYIKSITNPFLRQLLQDMITKDEEIKTRLALVPAGLKLHHSYRGGLLSHIYRLLVVGDNLVKTLNENPYPTKNPTNINRDMVIAALILHDIFKTREYSPNMEYEKAGNLVPHLPLVAIEVNRWMDKIENFPEEIRTQLTHVLLSHHGKIKYGSPVTPKTLEAIIVSQLDLMMSRLDPAIEALDALGPEDLWTQRLRATESEVYKGGSLIEQ